MIEFTYMAEGATVVVHGTNILEENEQIMGRMKFKNEEEAQEFVKIIECSVYRNYLMVPLPYWLSSHH